MLGERGSGKERTARALHDQSGRTGHCVAYNSASLRRERADSILFGHRRGAFTGATEDREGLFQRANGGTLILDEIGHLSPDVQPELLRVLETGEVYPVGATAPHHVDVRVVACTNREPTVLAADLLDRFLFQVRVPALRDRLEDLPSLVTDLCRSEPDLRGVTLHPSAVDRLARHDWPGNVRELRRVLLVSAALADTSHLRPRDLSIDDRTPAQVLAEGLERHEGNQSALARAMGIPRTTLRSRLTRHGLA